MINKKNGWIYEGGMMEVLEIKKRENAENG